MPLVVVIFAITLFQIEWRVSKTNVHAVIGKLPQRLHAVADDDLVESKSHLRMVREFFGYIFQPPFRPDRKSF